MKMYISGPITGYPNGNKEAFENAAEEILKRHPPAHAWSSPHDGYEIVNPHNNGLAKDSTWTEHMRADIKLLLDCDAVCMLPGWTASRGASIEYRIAKDLGLKVMDLEEWMQEQTYEEFQNQVESAG